MINDGGSQRKKLNLGRLGFGEGKRFWQMGVVRCGGGPLLIFAGARWGSSPQPSARGPCERDEAAAAGINVNEQGRPVTERWGPDGARARFTALPTVIRGDNNGRFRNYIPSKLH